MATKKKWINAWKVVEWRENHYRSCAIEGMGREVIYTIGRTVRPKYGNGPLCCFRTREHARTFGWTNGYRLLRVTVLQSAAQAVWLPRDDGSRKVTPIDNLPGGTVLCDRVKVLRWAR